MDSKVDNSRYSNNYSRVQSNNRSEINDTDDSDTRQKLIDIIDNTKVNIVNNNIEEAHDILLSTLKEVVDNENNSNNNAYFYLFEPCYYLLGECCIRMGKIKKAQDFLFSAFSNSLKNNKNDNTNIDDINEYKILRHRAFSKLFEYQSNFEKAIEELNVGIILECKLKGPESVLIVSLYYELGSLFLLQKKGKQAVRVFSKIIMIWFEHINSLITNYKENARAKYLEDEEKAAMKEATYTLHNIKKQLNKKRLFQDEHIKRKLLTILYFCQICIEGKDSDNYELLAEEFEDNLNMYTDDKEIIEDLNSKLNIFINN